MQKTFDVIILGAGTAGLTAMKEVRRHTNNFLLIDPGPLGTTCARVGCMPSKALVQIAHDVYRTRLLQKQEILQDKGPVHWEEVFHRVRRLRDHFVEPIVRDIKALGDNFLQGHARFTGPTTLRVDGQNEVSARSIIIATGSRPLIPGSWPRQHPSILTTDDFFEMERIPQKWAVVGLGPIGLELGQALAFLGAEVHGYDRDQSLGGLQDTPLNDLARDVLQRDMSLSFGSDVEIQERGAQLEIKFGEKTQRVDAVLAAIGRRPRLDELDLAKTGCEFDQAGFPVFDEETLGIRALPIYLAGDVDRKRNIIHEASDEGRLAGYNACHPQNPQRLERKTPLAVVFTQPGIATLGQRAQEGETSIIGKVSFEDQGRAKIMSGNQGAAHVYVAASNGRLLGADLFAPQAEHLAHLLAWAVQSELTVSELLQMPFYHPTLEEGLRTALRDAKRQL
jgi:dihydrolipoamide dehydrogenase